VASLPFALSIAEEIPVQVRSMIKAKGSIMKGSATTRANPSHSIFVSSFLIIYPA
jgi:hypothetical protein